MSQLFHVRSLPINSLFRDGDFIYQILCTEDEGISFSVKVFAEFKIQNWFPLERDRFTVFSGNRLVNINLG